MINILNIVKSRFIKGDNLPEWYEQRLNICSTCKLNSANIDKKNKSTGRKSWELIAGAHCTDPSCGCTITEKAKIEEESCPKEKWLAIREGEREELNIVTDTKKAIFSFNSKLKKYIVDYGEIPHKFDSNLDLLILDKSIVDLKVTTSCGCTSAEPEKVEEGTKLNIKYDTLRIGKFEKIVRLTYKKENSIKQTVISVRGTVNKTN